MAEDVPDAIRRVENVLRDLIEETLREKHGDDWIDHLGVSQEQIESWRARQEEDRKRRGSEAADQRLLYYADLHDLAPVLKRNWELLSPCLGQLREIEVYLHRLEDLRPAEAHGRALLPFEEHLVLGISGDIRQRVTVYRSQQSPESEFFARIESVRDSLGNVIVSSGSHVPFAAPGSVLRVGDEITFSCSGWDPRGQRLEWELTAGHLGGGRKAQDWSIEDKLVWHVSDEDIGRSRIAKITMRSQGPYHAHGHYDDIVSVAYTVLPARGKEA